MQNLAKNTKLMERTDKKQVWQFFYG
jgi:hypothetical protein